MTFQCSACTIHAPEEPPLLFRRQWSHGKYAAATCLCTVQQPHWAALQGLEDLDDLNGKTFADLDRNRQAIFMSCEISLRIVQTKADEDGLFELYTRMNTGSKNHSKQQNRRAIFRYLLLLSFCVAAAFTSNSLMHLCHPMCTDLQPN